MVFLDEKLAIHLIGGIFDEPFILLTGEDDADGRIIAFDILFRGEVAEIEVHLADVVMLHLVHFKEVGYFLAPPVSRVYEALDFHVR